MYTYSTGFQTFRGDFLFLWKIGHNFHTRTDETLRLERTVHKLLFLVFFHIFDYSAKKLLETLSGNFIPTYDLHFLSCTGLFFLANIGNISLTLKQFH